MATSKLSDQTRTVSHHLGDGSQQSVVVSYEQLSMEAEESPLLEATIKQQLVKTWYAGMTWSVL
jgi:hypothetical protein